jgi:LEA14-like dessication related protein
MKTTRRARSTPSVGNPYEALARARKARQIYAVVRAKIDETPGFPLTPENIHQIVTADSIDPARRDIERLAHVRPASKATWRQVEDLLIDHYFGP